MIRARKLALIAMLFAAPAMAASTMTACSGDDSSPGETTTDAAPKDAANGGHDTGAVDAALPDGATVGKPPGCFAGTPTTHAELINACTNAAYVMIDNCAAIGFCDGGTLPDRVAPPVDSGTDATSGGDAANDAANDGAADAAADVQDAGAG